MRPNTPHFVLTTESAICHGGHFYAMSSIRDTIFAIYHMFCCSKKITNTEHSKDSHLLILRLVTYVHHMLVRRDFNPFSSTFPAHIPNVTTLEGTLDLFYLCIMAELGELLHPAAYRKLRRNDKELREERLTLIYLRGLSREIQEWWCSHFTFFDPEPRKIIIGDVVYGELLSHQIKALVIYKQQAHSKKIWGEVRACTPATFEAMANKYFPVHTRRDLPRGATVEDFQWSGGGYTLRKSSNGITKLEPCTCESVPCPHS